MTPECSNPTEAKLSLKFFLRTLASIFSLVRSPYYIFKYYLIFRRYLQKETGIANVL